MAPPEPAEAEEQPRPAGDMMGHRRRPNPGPGYGARCPIAYHSSTRHGRLSKGGGASGGLTEVGQTGHLAAGTRG